MEINWKFDGYEMFNNFSFSTYLTEYQKRKIRGNGEREIVRNKMGRIQMI